MTTTTTHIDEFALFEYAEGTSEKREEIEAHLAGCADCAANISEHRRFVTALSQAAVWDKAPAPAPKSRLADLTAFNNRIAREDAAAVAILDQALTGPNPWWRNRLRQADNWRTAGVVRQLLERIRPTIDGGSPANALRLAELAVEVSNELNVATYPSDFVIGVRAQALRDHAYALAFIGRYPEALIVVERAETLLEQAPLPDYELARVKLVRSFVYRGLERGAEAVVLAREAAHIYATYGDRKRFIDARVFEAIMLHELGRRKEALAAFESVVDEPQTDPATHARVVHNIGVCLQELRRFREAAEYFSRATAEYGLLGIETECIRTRWMLGRTLVAARRAADAIPVLRDAWRQFEAIEMEIEAALVALDLVEALIVTRNVEQVPSICRSVLDRFVRAGMNSPAVTALAYLREAVAAGHADRTLVRHVHKFLRDLPKEPSRLFAAPPTAPGIRD
jgi:tetratricopeptide (TPR) repeat protein